MTLDWWGLGLQAINVLILVWLLSRVFWRPVAAAITRRQDAAQVMLEEGKTAQAKADAALAEVAETRAGLAAEREAILAEAKATADTAGKAALKDAQTKADALIAAARTAIDRDRNTARKENATRAAELSVEIAARLLGRFNTPAVQATFLAQLVEAIAEMSASDRAALIASADGTEIVTATDPEDAERAKIEKAVKDALGGTPSVRLVTDPDLIAGLELRSGHFVLHNSWRADLENILKEVENAA
ncbi:F0F1 ATP synthase subunit delta [Pseudophaeobacter flagellatus]|uniref:F0F1 ATP synthase subunit delta n=1 Tax=Pseudophaeobacter flagellatus TaxID=2899119 RepID=UPI001E2B1AD1|nr:F0F1 ATP synthase subunit delta [Pseudophaeobacter flagellatus]MCD9150092.1 F0F1 ATP synthase subunit delta [Pseudophaeobacter flagellatus]